MTRQVHQKDRTPGLQEAHRELPPDPVAVIPAMDEQGCVRPVSGTPDRYIGEFTGDGAAGFGRQEILTGGRTWREGAHLGQQGLGLFGDLGIGHVRRIKFSISSCPYSVLMDSG